MPLCLCSDEENESPIDRFRRSCDQRLTVGHGGGWHQRPYRGRRAERPAADRLKVHRTAPAGCCSGIPGPALRGIGRLAVVPSALPRREHPERRRGLSTAPGRDIDLPAAEFRHRVRQRLQRHRHKDFQPLHLLMLERSADAGDRVRRRTTGQAGSLKRRTCTTGVAPSPRFPRPGGPHDHRVVLREQLVHDCRQDEVAADCRPGLRRRPVPPEGVPDIPFSGYGNLARNGLS